jgi:hypothetical protein
VFVLGALAVLAGSFEPRLCQWGADPLALRFQLVLAVSCEIP